MLCVPPLTQVVPRRIHRNNQLHLLNPQPAFDPLLAVNRVAHIVKTFVVNESINLVALAEFRSVRKLVFPNPPVKIIGNSDVKRLGAIGQDINAVAASVVGMHRSFASLKMTVRGLCATKMRKSVRDVHQNCDDSPHRPATTWSFSHNVVILSEAKDLCIPLAPAKCIGLSLRSR